MVLTEPPFSAAATISQVATAPHCPMMAPMMAATALHLLHATQQAVGKTAEETMMPMPRYTHPNDSPILNRMNAKSPDRTAKTKMAQRATIFTCEARVRGGDSAMEMLKRFYNPKH